MTHGGQCQHQPLCQLEEQQGNQAAGDCHLDIVAVQRPEMKQFPSGWEENDTGEAAAKPPQLLVSLTIVDHPGFRLVNSRMRMPTLRYLEAGGTLENAQYGAAVTRRLRTMGIRDRPITPRSPWQNGHVERLIGSIRRECLDHVVVLGERHLRHLLANYAAYYNGAQCQVPSA